MYFCLEVKKHTSTTIPLEDGLARASARAFFLLELEPDHIYNFAKGSIELSSAPQCCKLSLL